MIKENACLPNEAAPDTDTTRLLHFELIFSDSAKATMCVKTTEALNICKTVAIHNTTNAFFLNICFVCSIDVWRVVDTLLKPFVSCELKSKKGRIFVTMGIFGAL